MFSNYIFPENTHLRRLHFSNKKLSVWYRFNIYDCFEKIEKKLAMKNLRKENHGEAVSINKKTSMIVFLGILLNLSMVQRDVYWTLTSIYDGVILRKRLHHR